MTVTADTQSLYTRLRFSVLTASIKRRLIIVLCKNIDQFSRCVLIDWLTFPLVSIHLRRKRSIDQSEPKQFYPLSESITFSGIVHSSSRIWIPYDLVNGKFQTRSFPQFLHPLYTNCHRWQPKKSTHLSVCSHSFCEQLNTLDPPFPQSKLSF